ncbi:hypothetical protein DFQ30_004556, partial [Apophysomyces sp. BC1015]
MGLRSFTPMVIACPGCGRTTSTVFQELASRIQDYLRTQMPVWRKQYPGVETMNVAVMGCIVNGPGESKHANIGISLPGTGENPAAPVFIDGVKTTTLRGERIAEAFQDIVNGYVERTYEQKHKVDKLTGVRGMNDILPCDAGLWEFFESTVKSMLRAYGYQSIRTPIIEHTQLFTRGIGEVTDIVEKEMYSFVDSLNGEHLTMRPENTAAVVRAAIEHNLLYDGPKRL